MLRKFNGFKSQENIDSLYFEEIHYPENTSIVPETNPWGYTPTSSWEFDIFGNFKLLDKTVKRMNDAENNFWKKSQNIPISNGHSLRSKKESYIKLWRSQTADLLAGDFYENKSCVVYKNQRTEYNDKMILKFNTTSPRSLVQKKTEKINFCIWPKFMYSSSLIYPLKNIIELPGYKNIHITESEFWLDSENNIVKYTREFLDKCMMFDNMNTIVTIVCIWNKSFRSFCGFGEEFERIWSEHTLNNTRLILFSPLESGLLLTKNKLLIDCYNFINPVYSLFRVTAPNFLINLQKYNLFKLKMRDPLPPCTNILYNYFKNRSRNVEVFIASKPIFNNTEYIIY